MQRRAGVPRPADGSVPTRRTDNRVNGIYACNNGVLLNDHLRGVLGFDGWVMSDWWAMKGATPGQVRWNGCNGWNGWNGCNGGP